MERVFARSEEAHQRSIANIMKSMSTKSAWHLLERNNLTSPALIQMTTHTSEKQAHLRKASPAGYSGIEGARKMLNEMIYKSMTKYDEEIAKCTETYAQNCAEMEECRGKIADSNYVAAHSRKLILDAEATIDTCERDIPATKQRRSQHLLLCKRELKRMRTRMTLLKGDIEVMDKIVGMTECKGSFLQEKKLSVLRCHDQCTQKSYIAFDQDDLTQQVNQLQSPSSHGLMQDTFQDLFEGTESPPSFLQLETRRNGLNKTGTNSEPEPRVEVPASPCQDVNGGAPSYRHKNTNKCSLSKSPACFKLQERFLSIQTGIEDEKDALKEEIAKLENFRDETRNNLDTQIANDQKMLDEANTNLADATSKEANAGETARETAEEHDTLTDHLKEEMKTCSTNYINFESELCALRKIRGELYKMQGAKQVTHQDCVVNQWEPDECDHACGGGQQTLTRSVQTPTNGGADCLPLSAERQCNMQPCPVDCKLADWQGWSKCSAECGGGVQHRMRAVESGMKHKGKPCDATTEETACNGQACEKDCELSQWSVWSPCSKACDGGTQKRVKYVAQEPEGAGKCPGKWTKKRLEYMKCNSMSCLSPKSRACSTWDKDTTMYTCETVPTCCEGYRGMGLDAKTVQCVPAEWAGSDYKAQCPAKTLKCNGELEVVLLIDGSGSLGEKGWNAEIKAAQMFVEGFSGTHSKASFSVILYSGPSNWRDYRACAGQKRSPTDVEATCKVRTVAHLTSNKAEVKEKIAALKWPKGSTFTSLALLKAKQELNDNGSGHTQSVVVVITDGKPQSKLKTYFASRNVRKIARLVWVPVTRNAPLRLIKFMATRRWQENLVRVKNFEDLEQPEPMSHVIADICPGGVAFVPTR
jgi:hypothetical protein